MENNIIKYIKETLSPKIEDISMISKHYKDVLDVLSSSLLFQSGSYPRNTAIKPVNDLDIISVLGHGKTQNDAGFILGALHKLLKTKESKDIIGYNHLIEQKSSIGIYFYEDEDKFSIDIVPVIETDKNDITYNTKIYLVPEIMRMNKFKRKKMYNDPLYKGDNWIYSAPKAYIAHANKLDKSSEDKFRYLTRFIKRRKKGCKNEYSEFCLKSFHIEQICGEIVERNPGINIKQAIDKFFYDINTIVAQGKHFEDLAYKGEWNETRHIDEYLENPEKNTKEFQEWLRKETIRVRSILGGINNEIDEPELITRIEKVLRIKKMSSEKIINNPPKGPWLLK